MDLPILTSLAEAYQWKLSLYAGLGILISVGALRLIARMIPTFRAAGDLNTATYRRKMEKTFYAENQKWNRKWGVFFIVVIFGAILPFCITADAQPWWKILLDTFVILMVYDFFYYLTHRFLFHDGGFLGGPLMWGHAVHHRQHNPCRQDSSFIHPIEVAVGLGLYVGTIFALSFLLGNFHVMTIIVTWVAFNQINLHNHDLWEESRFPFGYLNTMSVMHHNHHARFTGGNYATITLLYDWMFGTLDYGKGHPAEARRRARREAAAKAGPAA